MSAEPTDVNTSHLDELGKIASEQAGLRDLIDRARAFRDRSVEVCERVMRDYQKRIAALEEQARVLKEKAGEDLKTLVSRHDEARRAVEKARFEQQEIDFRYEIGELAKTDYPERRKAADEALARSEADFAAVDALKRRFMDALVGSEPAAEPTPAPMKAEDVLAGSVEERLAKVAGPAHVAPEAPASPAVPSTQPGTMAFQPPSATAPSAARSREPKTERMQVAASQISGSRPAAAEDGATVAIAPAVLRDEDAGGAVHQLSFVTTIGRTPDNEIVVPEAEVSRRHARVSLTDRGFVLEDLKSGNGTFLNGERITGEQLLKDEDRIRIGSRTFVFRVQ